MNVLYKRNVRQVVHLPEVITRAFRALPQGDYTHRQDQVVSTVLQ